MSRCRLSRLLVLQSPKREQGAAAVGIHQLAGRGREMSLKPQDRLGPYEILASIGSGGMGEVQ
jgi:hypothetical protein